MSELASEKLPSLSDLETAPLVRTGVDIPEGNYPGTLFGFSEPRWIPVSAAYQKPGASTKRAVFDVRLGIRLGDGTVQEVDYMTPIPEGGKAHVKSNLFKVLRAAGASDGLVSSEGVFGDKVSLKTFIGKPVAVGVKKNKNDWPQVETVTMPIKGLNYPTLEECKALQGSDGAPF